MTFDDELRDALTSYDPPRRTDFGLSQAVALATHAPPTDDEFASTIAEAPIGGPGHRRPTRNRVAIGAVAIAIAAAIGIVFVARNASSGPTSVADALGLHGLRSAASSDGLDPHEASARSETKKLLEAFDPPPGATRTNNSAPLKAPGTPTPPSNVIVLSRSWHLQGDAAGLQAKLIAAPPLGMQVIGAGNSAVDASDPSPPPATHGVVLAPIGAPMSGFDAVLAPGVKGSLQLSMVDIGNGVVVLRADAVKQWTRSRTSTEQLPSGTHQMVIARHHGMVAGNTVSHKSITDEAIIGQVATLLDGLVPGTTHGLYCGPGDKYSYLTFTTRPGGPPVAKAFVSGNGCGEVRITINGKTKTYYPGSDELIALIERLDP